MVSSPPMKMGGEGLFFRTSGVSTFSYGYWGDSIICVTWWESQLGICLGWTPVPISCQTGKCRFIKVNLTNCHREVCRIKFYQIDTSDVLTSL